jgi:hypothetical protein
MNHLNPSEAAEFAVAIETLNQAGFRVRFELSPTPAIASKVEIPAIACTLEDPLTGWSATTSAVDAPGALRAARGQLTIRTSDRLDEHAEREDGPDPATITDDRFVPIPRPAGPRNATVHVTGPLFPARSGRSFPAPGNLGPALAVDPATGMYRPAHTTDAPAVGYLFTPYGMGTLGDDRFHSAIRVGSEFGRAFEEVRRAIAEDGPAPMQGQRLPGGRFQVTDPEEQYADAARDIEELDDELTKSAGADEERTPDQIRADRVAEQLEEYARPAGPDQATVDGPALLTPDERAQMDADEERALEERAARFGGDYRDR